MNIKKKIARGLNKLAKRINNFAKKMVVDDNTKINPSKQNVSVNFEVTPVERKPEPKTTYTAPNTNFTPEKAKAIATKREELKKEGKTVKILKNFGYSKEEAEKIMEEEDLNYDEEYDDIQIAVVSYQEKHSGEYVVTDENGNVIDKDIVSF